MCRFCRRFAQNLRHVGNWDNFCVKEADGVWRFQSVVINAWMGRDKVPWKGEDPFAKVSTH